MFHEATTLFQNCTITHVHLLLFLKRLRENPPGNSRKVITNEFNARRKIENTLIKRALSRVLFEITSALFKFAFS